MKSTNTFGVRFIIRYTKEDLSEASIYARITVNKKRLEISLKRFVDPVFWDSKQGLIKGNKELEKRINPYIDEVRYKIMESYQDLRMQGKFITVDSVKRLFLG